TPLAEDPLTERLRARAARAGARVRGVYRLNLSAKTTAANAALMGLGNTRRIVLGDTLLDRYTPDEIDAVFTHELGHHVHRDIPRGLVFQLGLTLVEFFLAGLLLRAAVDAFGFAGIADVGAMPALALIFGALGLLTMPIGNARSRWVEAAADRYALEAGVSGPVFCAMMTKLGDQNLAEFAPPAWVEWLFYDHPSIGRRLAM